MKCPNCGNDMVQSRAGWLCLSCGHIEAKPSAVPEGAKITLGRDAHAQMAKAAKDQLPKKDEKVERADNNNDAPIVPPPLTPPPPEPAGDAEPKPEPANDPKPPPPPDPADQPEPPVSPPEDPPAQTPSDASSASVQPEPEPKPAVPPAVEPLPAPVASSPIPSIPPDEPDEDEKVDPPPEPPITPNAVPPAQPEPEPEPEPEPQSEQPSQDQGQPVVIPPPPQSAPPPPPPAPPPEPPKPPPEPAPASQSAAASAGPPTVPLNGKPPLQPVTHPKHGKFHLFGITAIAIIALAAASAAIFASVVAPRLALAGYLSRLGNAKTMTFSAIVNNADAGYRFALKLNGTTDLGQASQPKLAAAISGNVSAPNGAQTNPITGQLTANLVTSGQNLYFKLTSLALQSQVVGLGPSANWYSLNLASSSSAKCLAQGSGPGSLLASSSLAAMPVKSASLVGIGKLNGALALHYRGTVDTSKLPSAAGQNLSSNCQVAVAALKSTHLTYDIWRSWSQDRLELAVSSTTSGVPTTLLLDTSAYSRPVAINAPTGAQNAANLFTNVLGASTIAPGVAAAVSTHSTPAAIAPPTPTSAAPDTQTRADLAAYLAAYSARATNGYFPTAPATITVAAASKSYTIVTARPTTPGQIWYQAGGVCNGPSHVPGRTATHYLALTTLLADGTPACLDSGN